MKPPPSHYMTDSVISADGTKIGYRQLGKGPGLILVHGGMQSSASFMKLAEALSDTYTLYIPDRRGRGLSGPHGDHHSVVKECEDIKALMDKTGAVYLFGLSAGATILLQASLVLPNVRKTALYEPPLLIDRSYSTDWVSRYDQELAQGKLGAAFVTVMKGTQVSPVFDVFPRFLLNSLFTFAIKSETPTKENDISLKTLISTMHFDLRLVLDISDKLETFRNVQTEVLLLGGSKSPAYLLKALDGLKGVLPNSKSIIFSGLDHLGPDNDGKPEIVAQELRRFFTVPY